MTRDLGSDPFALRDPPNLIASTVNPTCRAPPLSRSRQPSPTVPNPQPTGVAILLPGGRPVPPTATFVDRTTRVSVITEREFQ